MLGGHPLLCASLKHTARPVILESAEPATGDIRVEVHVSALKSIGGVAKLRDSKRGATLEIRNRRSQQQRNRLGPWPLHSANLYGRGTGNGHESARAPVTGGHRERAARAQAGFVGADARLDQSRSTPDLANGSGNDVKIKARGSGSDDRCGFAGK